MADSSSKSTSHFNTRSDQSQHQLNNKENRPPVDSHNRHPIPHPDENYNSDIQYLSHAVKFSRIDSHRSPLTATRDAPNPRTSHTHDSVSNRSPRKPSAAQDYASLSLASKPLHEGLHRSLVTADNSDLKMIETSAHHKSSSQTSRPTAKPSSDQDSNKLKLMQMARTLRQLLASYEEQLKISATALSAHFSDMEKLGYSIADTSKQEEDVSGLKAAVKQLWNDLCSSETDRSAASPVISELLAVLPKLVNLVDSFSALLATSRQAGKKQQELHRKTQALHKMQVSFWNSLGIDHTVLNKRIERFVRQRRAANTIARHFRAYRRDKEKSKLKRIHQTNHAMFQAGSGKYLLQALMQRSEDYFVQVFSKLRPEPQAVRETVSEKRADALRRLTQMSK